MISWNDAKAFAEWLSRQGGGQFRLPTEAEWEYAARAGTTTVYFWGDKPDGACLFANVNDQTSKRANGFKWPVHDCDDGYAQTAPVGSFRPNASGLHDMLGNVYQWCEDEFDPKAYAEHSRDNPVYLRDSPVVVGGRSRRAFRGGSWGSYPGITRVANRFGTLPEQRSDEMGFRLARTN